MKLDCHFVDNWSPTIADLSILHVCLWSRAPSGFSRNLKRSWHTCKSGDLSCQKGYQKSSCNLQLYTVVLLVRHGAYDSPADFARLKQKVDQLESHEPAILNDRLFYLALPPHIFQVGTHFVSAHFSLAHFSLAFEVQICCLFSLAFKLLEIYVGRNRASIEWLSKSLSDGIMK